MDRYSLLLAKYNVFEVRFNPYLEKAQDKYKMFTESVTSITLSSPPSLKLYINFNDAGIENTTIYDEFLKIISSIFEIEIIIGDKEGNIIEKRIYSGKFTEVMHTDFIYTGDLKFLAVFELDKNKLK